MLICTLLLLYPAYSGGTGYDIHENCFLTPLILWLFYGIDRKNTAITAAAAAAGAVCFAIAVVPNAIPYPIQAIQNYEYHQNIRDTLDRIPDGASVTATTFYTPHLSQREILYDVRYCSREHLLETDYVVLKLSSNSDYKKYAAGSKDNGFDNLVKLLEENGYTEYESLDHVLVIYHKE